MDTNLIIGIVAAVVIVVLLIVWGVVRGKSRKNEVVGRPADRAVVMQERIGHVAKPLLDAGRVGQDRLAADVRRGGDERAAEFLYEQVVQR